MNLAKQKHCIFESAGDCSGSLVSLVYIVSTVGVTPRKQKASKSVVCCLGHTSSWAALQGDDMAKPMLDTLEALTERREHFAALRVGESKSQKTPCQTMRSNGTCVGVCADCVHSSTLAVASVSNAPAVVDARTAALAMNRRRWSVLKIGHKK